MFNFNTSDARAADSFGGKIEDSGCYAVTIKQAYVTKGASPKQSEALTLELVTDAGDTGKLFLWYQKADGSRNDYAVHAVNALMGVLKLRELSQSDGQIDAYDYDTKEPVKKPAQVFKALFGQKLKMAIQAKWDTYNGKSRVQLELKCPATLDGFTVSEILDRSTKPEMLQRAIDKLKPIGTKPSVGDFSGAQYQDYTDQSETPRAITPSMTIDDDDLPF